MLRLGDHSFSLIENRQAGIRQFVIRRSLDEPLSHIDRFVELVLMGVGHGQGVESIDVVRIFFQRFLVGANRLVQLILRKELHTLVVAIFLAHSLILIDFFTCARPARGFGGGWRDHWSGGLRPALLQQQFFEHDGIDRLLENDGL